MVLPVVAVSWKAIIIAAVASFAIGGIWYSPALFANQWMALIGKKKEELQGGAVGYVVALIGSLVTAYVLANLVSWAGADTAMKGAAVGIFAWLGFNAFTNFTMATFEGRPTKLWAINSGSNLVILAVSGAILAIVH